VDMAVVAHLGAPEPGSGAPVDRADLVIRI